MFMLSSIGLLGLSFAAFTATATITLAQETQRPNIVFMLMDNLGYRDVGVYGAVRGAPTPRIDGLRSPTSTAPEC